jgi:hypothetical protein
VDDTVVVETVDTFELSSANLTGLGFVSRAPVAFSRQPTATFAEKGLAAIAG